MKATGQPRGATMTWYGGTRRHVTHDLESRLFAALRASGMAEVPDGFSVAPVHQEIPAEVLAGIDAFLVVFERVTTRASWQQGVTASAPELAQQPRREVCFFSAWDFHLPPGAPECWQLIECNDNGSGFLFAALINRHFHGLSGLSRRGQLEPPPDMAAFQERLVRMITREAGGLPAGTGTCMLILDDPESLERGKFRDEHVLLRDLLRRQGCDAEIAPPQALRWSGPDLLLGERRVSFVVNRSTDFHWQGEAFAALRTACRAGAVRVAPNPFSHATRSDKRLLEALSCADRDAELGVQPDERAVLSAHVPETRLVREENLGELVRRKQELVFKPACGYAGRGLLPSDQVGRSRLRRLLRHGEVYVAQRRVPRTRLSLPDGGPLWADLRVWAYRGERYLISGRASRTASGLDLRPPGGWLPTYAIQPSRSR